jgi:ABC-type transport system involved in cytochrome c biogenesis permease subunit
MNRRALHLAFPLLSAGAVVGLLLLVQHPERIHGWSDPKIVATTLLWLGFALLLVLRYRVPLRGRRLALLTILAFGLLLVSLASAHGIVSGGGR